MSTSRRSLIVVLVAVFCSVLFSGYANSAEEAGLGKGQQFKMWDSPTKPREELETYVKQSLEKLKEEAYDNAKVFNITHDTLKRLIVADINTALLWDNISESDRSKGYEAHAYVILSSQKFIYHNKENQSSDYMSGPFALLSVSKQNGKWHMGLGLLNRDPVFPDKSDVTEKKPNILRPASEDFEIAKKLFKEYLQGRMESTSEGDRILKFDDDPLAPHRYRLRDFRYSIHPRETSQLDRMNGYQYQATGVVRGSFYKVVYEDGTGWGDWSDWMEMNLKLYFAVSKRNGAWKVDFPIFDF